MFITTLISKTQFFKKLSDFKHALCCQSSCQMKNSHVDILIDQHTPWYRLGGRYAHRGAAGYRAKVWEHIWCKPTPPCNRANF
jgi:hypothetical protein